MTRVTIDLDDHTAAALDRWLAMTAPHVGSQLEAGEAIGAMIRVVIRFEDITDTVASQIRLDRAAAQEQERDN